MYLSLSFLRSHFNFTTFLANPFWIRNLFHDLTFSFVEFTVDSISFSRIHFEIPIFATNFLRIDNLFREFTLNFLICFANSLSMHYFFRDFLKLLSISRIHYFFREFILNSQVLCFLTAFKTIWLERTRSIQWYTISSLPIFDHKIWFSYWSALLNWILPAGQFVNRGLNILVGKIIVVLVAHHIEFAYIWPLNVV